MKYITFKATRLDHNMDWMSKNSLSGTKEAKEIGGVQMNQISKATKCASAKLLLHMEGCTCSGTDLHLPP